MATIAEYEELVRIHINKKINREARKRKKSRSREKKKR